MKSDREPKRTANPDAAGWPDDAFSADLGHGGELVDVGDTTEESQPLGHHEAARLRQRLGETADRITVLKPGTRLQQGSTYVDLERLDEGPFVAMAGQHVENGQLVVSKRTVDHELWNAIVGRDTEPDRVRPG
jgi:hypothetical protein